jgi:MurNAc alpha-1-phosphate uridylyltransferase
MTGAGGPETAMVLAAGLGTRMGALTRDMAKPLLRAGGRALIDHALDRAEEAGVRRAVVNLHWHADKVRAHLAGRRGPEILFSEEREAPLETGGGVVRARPLLGEAPVFVLNSDAVFGGPPPLPLLAAGWDEARMDGLLLLIPKSAARAYTRAGDFRLSPDGRPQRRGAAPEAPWVYAGAQIARPAAFEGFGDGAFSANLVWDRLLAAGRLFAVAHPGPWVDVGTPEGLAEADALHRR